MIIIIARSLHLSGSNLPCQSETICRTPNFEAFTIGTYTESNAPTEALNNNHEKGYRLAQSRHPSRLAALMKYVTAGHAVVDPQLGVPTLATPPRYVMQAYSTWP